MGVLTLREWKWSETSHPSAGEGLSSVSAFQLLIFQFGCPELRTVCAEAGWAAACQGGPGGFLKDNGVMQTGREQLMECRNGSNQGKGRGRELVLTLVGKDWQKVVD